MTVPRNRSTILTATGLAMMLTACSGTAEGGYPSLARRPAERVAGAPLPPCAQGPAADCADCAPGRTSGSALPVAAATEPAAPAISDPATQSRLASLVAQARGAHERFRAKQPGTERALSAAAGGPVASDAWSTAAIALADLESARNDTSAALSALDSLFVEDSLAHPATPGPDSAAIADARATAAELVALEDAVLARLRPRLPG